MVFLALGIFPPRNFSPIKRFTEKFPAMKFPPGNSQPFHCLSSLDCLSINGGESVHVHPRVWTKNVGISRTAYSFHIYTLVSGRKMLVSPEQLTVFSLNFGNINKVFLKNIFHSKV